MMAMMMTPTPVRLILVSLLLLFGAASAWADGTLTHLSGPVSVKKPDGKTLLGAVGIQVGVGDVVVTGVGGFARIEMTDGGEMVLRPDSQLQIDKYTFAQAKPTEDNFVFSMLKGGLRTVTGLVGKRGNRDAYKLNTVTATIGIRGTQFDLRVCAANCGALADGTYLAVRFGAVQTSNAQGSLAVAAGQVAYVPPQRPPVILPRDPGIGFTPPAVIPKLDEKKKVQAEAVKAEVASKVEQARNTGKATEKTEKTEKAETGSTVAAKSGTAPAASAASPESASATAPTASSAPNPAASPGGASSGGVECSVQ
jgi:hypothetical protein